jgi:Tfp pilus assembly PilM family ATPase
MFTKQFFKLFPPPKFLDIVYSGLDISDDAIHCIEYSKGSNGFVVHKFGVRKLEPGIVVAGFIKKEQELISTLASLVQELKIHTVKASLPEERMYLFKTEVPNVSESQIRQNIEFKLEENVPLSPADALFFFELIPGIKNDDKLHASVSVAPRDLVESYLNVLRSAGLEVISFEIQPKSIAHAILPSDCHETQIIVYGMNNKYGIYVVSSGVVCFTSTIDTTGQLDNILQLELKKVYQYWNEHEPEKEIKKIKLTGKGSIQIFNDSKISPDPRVSVEVGNVWSNAFSNDNYIPPISFEDSQEYVVAAGLALQ